MHLISQRIKDYFTARKPLFCFLSWFILGTAFLFCLIALRYLFILLSSDRLFISYVDHSAFFGKVFVLSFTATAFLGHFTLLAFLPLFLLITPLILCFNNQRLIVFFTIISGTLLAIFLCADSFIYANYHFHINLALLKLIYEYGSVDFFGISRKELFFVLGGSLAILIFEITLAFLITKWAMTLSAMKLCKKIFALLFACLYFSYTVLFFSMAKEDFIFSQQTPNFPLYNHLLAAISPYPNTLQYIEKLSNTRFSQPLFPNAPLHYPLHPLVCQPRQKPYNILIITVDTLRYDVINPTLTPHLHAFAKHALQFQQHLSGGNSTQAGLFSLFYSLPSNYWTSMLQQKQGALFIDTLIRQGYQLNILFSSYMIPPFDETIFRSIKHLRKGSAPGETVPDKDHFVTTAFNEFLQTRDQHHPFFAFIFYDTVHDYCSKQNVPMLYPTANLDCMRLTKADKATGIDVYNRYKNAVHYVDNEMAQVFTALKNKGLLANTIVIITSDHGEEFNDTLHNDWGHGTNYTRYQIKAPFIVYFPGHKPAIFSHQTSHYDIVPTLMRRLLRCQNDTKDYSIGKDLFDKHDPAYVLVGSYINMAIVEKTRNATLLTSGEIRMNDNEAEELHDAKLDPRLLADAFLKMRAYYQSQKF